MTSFRNFGMLALISLATVLGCGGAEEVKPTEANITPEKAPPSQPPVAVQPKPVAAPKPAKAKPVEPELPPLEEGFERFVVTADEGPEYLLSNEPPPSELFASVAPPSGTNSSTFAATIPAAPAAAPTATLPDGFTPVPDSGVSEEGYPLRIVCDKDSSEMAFVPAGIVRMGLRSGPSEATPELAVKLDPFYIDVTEVTVARYELYRQDMLATKKLFKQQPANPTDPPNYPVRGVPWGEAKLYATWAGKAIPTEAQWEMAARGPHGFLHPWGNDKAVWPKKRDMSTVSAVKSYRTDQSIYGVFDLAGNVREWTADMYSPTAFKDAQNLPINSLKNWEGPRKGTVENSRVVKGNGPEWGVWARSGALMRDKNPDIGYRCVVQLRPE